MREEKVRWKAGEESFYKPLNNEILRLLVPMVHLHHIDHVHVFVMIATILYLCTIVFIYIIFSS